MFDKDLGYLDKFFDNLEAHADTLDASAGDELRALIADERTRWGRITALVNGGAASAPDLDASAAPEPDAAPEREAASARTERDERARRTTARVSQPAPPPPTGTYSRLTVGSLIKS